MKTIKIIQVFIKIKILLIRMYCIYKQCVGIYNLLGRYYDLLLKVSRIIWSH